MRSNDIMVTLRILALLTLTAGFSCDETSNCSYLSLLRHLNLATSNHLLAITRPVKNWTKPTHVVVGMLFYGILNVDEKAQTVTSHIWIQMTWENEFLTWNKTDFCGINLLSIPTSMLWIPDVTIQEDASDSGSIYRSPLAALKPNGWLMTEARQRLTTTCHLGLRDFPFDTQGCNFTFASMTIDATAVTMGALVNGTILTYISDQMMITSGEWELRHLKVESDLIKGAQYNRNRLIYMVKIARKPLLYLINLIVPLFYLLVLDLASFFISEARGEKLSFKVTVLLSISVLLLILQDMLPSTEERLPLIATYCIAIFAMVGVSVLEATLVSYLTDLDGFCFKKAQSTAQEEIEMEADQQNKPDATEEEVQVQQNHSYLPLDGPSSVNLLKGILVELQAARQEAERQQKHKEKRGYYRRVAEIIDSVFFVLYISTVIIFMIFMYAEWIHKYVTRYD